MSTGRLVGNDGQRGEKNKREFRQDDVAPETHSIKMTVITN